MLADIGHSMKASWSLLLTVTAGFASAGLLLLALHFASSSSEKYAQNREFAVKAQNSQAAISGAEKEQRPAFSSGSSKATDRLETVALEENVPERHESPFGPLLGQSPDKPIITKPVVSAGITQNHREQPDRGLEQYSSAEQEEGELWSMDLGRWGHAIENQIGQLEPAYGQSSSTQNQESPFTWTKRDPAFEYAPNSGEQDSSGSITVYPYKEPPQEPGRDNQEPGKDNEVIIQQDNNNTLIDARHEITPSELASQRALQTSLPDANTVPGAKPQQEPGPGHEILGSEGLIAIVMDDLGHSSKPIDRLLSLPQKATLAFLPYPDLSRQLSEKATRADYEVILHMPMQAGSDTDPGPGALFTDLSAAEVEERLKAAIAKVPSARGINNHMGSQFTSDGRSVSKALKTIRELDLFVLDSRTSGSSKLASYADKMGLQQATRDIFIDHDPSHKMVVRQLAKIEHHASLYGSVIAIGHPNETTLSALERWVPAAHSRGFRFVNLSELIHYRECRRSPQACEDEDTLIAQMARADSKILR